MPRPASPEAPVARRFTLVFLSATKDDPDYRSRDQKAHAASAAAMVRLTIRQEHGDLIHSGSLSQLRRAALSPLDLSPKWRLIGMSGVFLAHTW